MLNKVRKFIPVLLMLMMVIPFISVSAKEATVNSQSDLKEALADSDVTSIVLGSNINTTEKINITRPVTIDGQGHTIKYTGTFGSDSSTDNTVWGGIYALQVYKTSATIKDIKLTGANAALLVNGSTVILQGTIDVSGNGFGGIELGQGSGVDTTVKLTIDNNATIVNTTESEDKPTLWVPEDSEEAIVEMNGTTQTIASGEQLSLDELKDLFGTTEPEVQPNPDTQDKVDENPTTGDSIIIFLISGLVGMLIFCVTFKNLRKDIKEL